MIISGMFRINCKLSDDIIRSDLFFNYKDVLCKYDILDGELKFKDLINIKKVLNELLTSNDENNGRLIIRGRMV